MTDNDDYPTEEELKTIRLWDSHDVHGLLDFIHSLWWQPEWGWSEYEGREGEELTRVIQASTGGWSGNEELMDNFRVNFLAYHQAFESYRRGGHYQFALPKKVTP